MNIFIILSRLLRPLLLPLSLLYGLLMRLRNLVYDKGVYNSVEFDIPVISVGNLSTGGTGKTPHIEYLIRLLEYEYKVATMSRGYKRKTQGFLLAGGQANAALIGDEPMQFHRKFPEITVSVCEDRMTGIPELMSLRPETEVILLDDAYQHRSVKPGLNILITEYQKPFYKDFILPFGSLREGRQSYKRADIIIISKSPKSLSEKQEKEIKQAIQPFPHQTIFFSTIHYDGLFDFFSNQPITPGKAPNFILVSGIAKPEPLLDHLRQYAASVHLLRYPDHHYFSENNLDEIRKTHDLWPAPDKAIIISEKDATRLALWQKEIKAWNIPVYVQPVRVRFLKNESQFRQTIVQYVESVRPLPEH